MVCLKAQADLSRSSDVNEWSNEICRKVEIELKSHNVNGCAQAIVF